MYSNDLGETELFEIKLMLGNYFAKKASDVIDEVWEQQNLTEQDMINWTNEHDLTPLHRLVLR